MYAQKFRLKGKRNIDKVYKEKSTRGSFFVVRQKSNFLDYPRIAIVVSKKVSPKAVVRNKLKRRTSEVIRLNLEKLQGKDLIITILPHATEKDLKELKTDLIEVLTRTGVLK
jgi:ribonuclease P protein component